MHSQQSRQILIASDHLEAVVVVTRTAGNIPVKHLQEGWLQKKKQQYGRYWRETERQYILATRKISNSPWELHCKNEVEIQAESLLQSKRVWIKTTM